MHTPLSLLTPPLKEYRRQLQESLEFYKKNANVPVIIYIYIYIYIYSFSHRKFDQTLFDRVNTSTTSHLCWGFRVTQRDSLLVCHLTHQYVHL